MVFCCCFTLVISFEGIYFFFNQELFFSLRKSESAELAKKFTLVNFIYNLINFVCLFYNLQYKHEIWVINLQYFDIWC